MQPQNTGPKDNIVYCSCLQEGSLDPGMGWHANSAGWLNCSFWAGFFYAVFELLSGLVWFCLQELRLGDLKAVHLECSMFSAGLWLR